MVTKAEITSIDYGSNKCTIRIPLFETASVNSPILATANLAITPGTFNSYKVGDIVIVAFENNVLNEPIIIGKYYQGALTENKDPRGALNISDLIVDHSAVLPMDTRIKTTSDKDRAEEAGGIGAYESLGNVVDSIRSQRQRIIALEDTNASNTDKLKYVTTTYRQPTEPRNSELTNGDIWIYTGSITYKEAFKKTITTLSEELQNDYKACYDYYLYTDKDNDKDNEYILITPNNASNYLKSGETYTLYNRDLSPNQMFIYENGKWIDATNEKLAEYESSIKQNKTDIDARVTKTYTSEHESTENSKWFGWKLNEEGFIVYTGSGKDENNKTNVLEVTKDGANINGDFEVSKLAEDGPKKEIIFSAKPSTEEVQIAGFKVDKDSMSAGNLTENTEEKNYVLVSPGKETDLNIGGNPTKKKLAFAAGDSFGVTPQGKVYASDINIDGIEFDTSLTNVGLSYKLTYKLINTKEDEAYEEDTTAVVKYYSNCTLTIQVDSTPEIDLDITLTYNKLNIGSDSENKKLVINRQTIYQPIIISKGITECSIELTDVEKDSLFGSPEKYNNTSGNFINRYGAFIDKNGCYTLGYRLDLNSNGNAGANYITTWHYLDDTNEEQNRLGTTDITTIYNGDYCYFYVTDKDFKFIKSVVASPELHVTPINSSIQFIISDIDYSYLVTHHYIKLTIKALILGVSKTSADQIMLDNSYNLLSSDKIHLSIYGGDDPYALFRTSPLTLTIKENQISGQIPLIPGKESISNIFNISDITITENNQNLIVAPTSLQIDQNGKFTGTINTNTTAETGTCIIEYSVISN